MSAEQQLLTRLRAKIDLADLAGLAERSDKHHERQALTALMAQIEADLTAISDRVTSHYFSHAEPLAKSGPIWLGSTP